MDIGYEVKALRELLDARDELNAQLKENGNAIRQIEDRLTDYCEKVGVDQVKVDGVLSLSIKDELRISYDKDNWDGLIRWAADTGNIHIVQRRISEKPIKELMSTLGDNFPAHLFKYDEYKKVSTRRI